MIEQDRIIATDAIDEYEVRHDTSIRPLSFSDYLGQSDVVSQLKYL